MSVLRNFQGLSRDIGLLCRRFCSVQLETAHSRAVVAPKTSNVATVRMVHTTPVRAALTEFFDHKDNWSVNEVKVGRSWKTDELRIKSNSDLHMLWFILLKERNMLMTMEHECNDKMELFPSPERLDKVKESMQNLETVVRERNRAYYTLETGENGERPGRLVDNQFGLKFFYRSSEHVIPYWMNTKWRETHKFRYEGYAVRKFLRLYREKLWNVKRKANNRNRNQVMHLLRRFPDMDRKVLADKYPDVDIGKLISRDKCRGHHVPR